MNSRIPLDSHLPHRNNDWRDLRAGDIKILLDNVKNSAMDHFRELYKPSSQLSINEKIDDLQQYHYPSAFPISNRANYYRPYFDFCHSKNDSNKLFNVDDHRNLYSDSGYLKSSLMHKNSATHFGYVDEYLSHTQNKMYTDTFSLNTPQSVKETHKNEYRDKFLTVDCNGLIQENIMNTVKEINKNAEKATRSLKTCTSKIDRELNNPSSRFFKYRLDEANSPFLNAHNFPEIKYILTQLLSDLYCQLEYNDQKIRTLKQKINLIKMNASEDSPIINKDPRIAL